MTQSSDLKRHSINVYKQLTTFCLHPCYSILANWPMDNNCFPEQQYFFRLLLTLADTCICLFKKYNFGRYRYYNSPNRLLPCLNVHFYKSKYPIYKKKTIKQQQTTTKKTLICCEIWTLPP